MINTGSYRQWHPTSHLQHGTKRSALLILNQPLQEVSIFERLWKNSEFRICADGGANRLYDGFSMANSQNGHEMYLPDEICGDLDSLRAEVAAFYRARGVHIVHKPSQYATDFAKCVDRIKSFQQHGKQVEAGGITAPSKPLDIVVLGGLGGRVDQGFAVMHQLCVLAEDDQAPGIKDIVLYSDRSVSFVLQPGCNRITTPLTEGYLTENVGIIPLGRAAVISTDGLEWDVQDWPTKFGKQVSTSNHIKKDTVSVIVDVNVLFTVELSETLPLEKVE